jgi:hypothetical protein
MKITNDNWRMARYGVLLKATVDNKYDGDHVRQMTLMADYLVNDSREKENVTKKSVQVCKNLVRRKMSPKNRSRFVRIL